VAMERPNAAAIVHLRTNDPTCAPTQGERLAPDVTRDGPIVGNAVELLNWSTACIASDITFPAP